MKNLTILKYLFSISMLGIISNGCVKDLDTVPKDPETITAAAVFNDPASYRAVLAKVYAGLATTGQQGPAGQADIEGIDEGFGQYLRGYWYHQELSTDEAVIGWNDQTIKDFHEQDWTSGDGFIFAFYSRLYYQIVICNEFLRETTDEKLNARGQSNLLDEIHGYRAEVRFLRALSYWHALDLFRNVPFVTEDNPVGSFFPEQIQAADLFAYLESDLLAIENEIAPARTNEYGRADQGAVWTLLAKLYLNAETYIGTNRYADCATYCNKVINAGYTLEPKYQDLFLADNHRSDEIIFPITFDGVYTRTYGGTTFLVFGGIGGSMIPAESGVSGAWGGMRTTKQFVQKFPEDIGGIITVPNEGNTVSYTKLYVPGAYQGWNASNTKTALSQPVTGSKIFEGHVYFPEDNSPFFFTTVPSFALRLGDNGSDGTLEMNGDTIHAGPAGLYYIQVNRNTNTYIMERRSWGIAGDATSGGWDVDQDMTWNPGTEALEIAIDLTDGAFKFRANDSWDVNLGDNNEDALLTYNGANINIENGSYLIRLFLDKPDYTYEILSTSFDTRGLFYTSGQSLDINDITQFTHGYAIRKYRNITSEGLPGSNRDFVDVDFPMFRLADVLLMASEALVRQGTSDGLALTYFNQVRNRAYGGSGGGISSADLTLQMLIDERARELYWECHRRTDLVRFGLFSDGNYNWAWKGGVFDGKNVEAFRDVFPLPSSDLGANPNLEQNPGY